MLSKQTQEMIYMSIREAEKRNHPIVVAEHLAYRLLSDAAIVDWLQKTSVDTKAILKNLDKFLDTEIPQSIAKIQKISGSIGFKRIIDKSIRIAKSANLEAVEPGLLFLSILEEKDCFAAYYLLKGGFKVDEVEAFLNKGEQTKSADEDFEFEKDSQLNSKAMEAANGAAKFSPRKFLSIFESEKRKFVGREEEMSRLIQVLKRYRKNNPLLVGDPGVGKSALVERLLQMINSQQIDPFLQQKQIFHLDLAQLLAGSRFRGDFEGRFKETVEFLEDMSNAILVIDEFHTVIGTGSTSGGGIDLANLLKPVLARGKLQCIAMTSFQDFRTHLEKDKSLIRRFQKIEVKEPSSELAEKVVLESAKNIASFHKVSIKPEAIKASVSLSVRYLPEKSLPDKAIDLLDEACVMATMEERKNKKFHKNACPEVNEVTVEQAVARIAQIPAKKVNQKDKASLKDLESDLGKVVFGQKEAIQAVSYSIKLSRAGLRDPEKPIGSFLFTGPTGVGKTEVAKQLARTLGVSFLRFDMSEYMERHTVSRLIGAPPGYVGFEQGGLLTDAVHKTPYAVLLLDEIEKAHFDIYNMLLQIMDYGKLTDSNGRTTDFRHVVLIMTSNVGAREMAQGRIGFGDDDNKFAGDQVYKKLFSPEFRNRLDARIAFSALEPSAMNMIVDKFLSELSSQLQSQKVTLRVLKTARQYLSEKGYDKTMGARPLGRLIQEEVKKPLAEQILFGPLAEGGKVTIGLKSGKKLSLNIKRDGKAA